MPRDIVDRLSMTMDDARPKPALVTAGAGVPLHRQLFLVLLDEIARGGPPGRRAASD
jgi:hypothetical protein